MSNDNNLNLRKEKFQLAHKDEQLHDTKFETRPVGYIEDCLRRFAKNKASVAGGIIILLIALFAIITPIVSETNYVDPTIHVTGFKDKTFESVLPKLFDDANGFWDGTETRVLGETDYELNRYTDSNYERLELVEVIETKDLFGRVSKKYKVRWDTYAVGNKIENLSKEEYQALLDYEVEMGITNSISVPTNFIFFRNSSK